MSDKLRVVVVDDYTYFREGMADVLSLHPDIEVVGQGGTAAEAIQLVVELLPDIVTLDISMPGGGLAAAQQIAVNCPVTKIVMLTSSDDKNNVTAALKAGARAYVLKDVRAHDLVQILRRVWAGEAYVTPEVSISL